MTHLTIDARMIRSSGIGTIISNILPRLMALRPDWHYRVLGAPQMLSAYSWSRAGNVEIVPFEAPIYSIREQIAWPARARDRNELLWCPNYNIPFGWNGRIMVNVNDVAHLALPEAYGGLLKSRYASFMYGRVRRRADSIVYISQFSADDFHVRVGQPTRARESVVHCGVDPAWFAVPPGDALRLRPYILFVGNVKPHKNLSRLLDAFAAASSRIPHDLVIVGQREGFITGDTGVGGKLAQFGGRVDFTGYIPDAELKRLVAQADALVLPSLYEGFGLPSVEAMAAGCPTLVSRAASMPEVCRDASLYFDPLNIEDMAREMTRIVSDEALRMTLRQKGLVRAHSLSWDVAAKGYLAALEAI